ncbi:MAG TPA: inorganic phosphate transporter [Sphingomicrobium sp.]|nr:inorganic phosphate transporter [Sphingomicrobium sp.]
MVALLVFSALFLAFANGANDNFKGFATVWGTGSLSYRRTLIAATLATVCGSIVSFFLAQDLVRRFSGKGLVPDAVAADQSFVAAVALGAASTVMVATRIGMPISTTHALLGGLVGAGAVASGTGIDLAVLGSGFLLPLLLSPLAAAALGLGVYMIVRSRRMAADCACLADPMIAAPALGATLQLIPAMPQLVVAPGADCDRLPVAAVRLSVPGLVDRVHLLSATTICFARSVNDTPKLAALLVAGHGAGLQVSVGSAALMMALGGLLMARRVAETMSLRINRMDPTQGVSANIITAGLVLMASRFGLPVSTTHVSVGSIAGVGAGAGTLDPGALRSVLLSWVATLPFAAAASAIVALVLH